MSLEPTPQVLAALRSAASQTGVPLSLLWGVAFVESRFNPSAVSPAGAQGLMQLMPATQALYKVTDPFDPVQSARGGAQMLARLAKGTSWNVPGMLYAYNWGPTRYARAKTEGTAIPSSVQAYARQVLAAQHVYRNKAPKPLGNVLERINAALVALAALNPAYEPATQALAAWAPFYRAHSRDSDASVLLALQSQAKAHWLAYAKAYERAPLTDESTPLPQDVEPDFWAESSRAIDAAGERVKQFGQQAAFGLGAGLFVVALFVFAATGRRRGERFG